MPAKKPAPEGADARFVLRLSDPLFRIAIAAFGHHLDFPELNESIS